MIVWRIDGTSVTDYEERWLEDGSPSLTRSTDLVVDVVQPWSIGVQRALNLKGQTERDWCRSVLVRRWGGVRERAGRPTGSRPITVQRKYGRADE